jgi:glycosyltransferase involved in cell wall biosynthesis
VRVALVVGSSAGGMGRHVARLVGGLAGLGFPVDVYCPAATQRHFGLAAAGAVVTPLEIPADPGVRDVRVVVELRRALRERPVDLLHAHGLRAGFVASLARPDGLPLITTWHTTFAPNGARRAAQRALGLAVARAADVTLCVSTGLADQATRLGARDVRLSPVIAAALPPAARPRAEVLAEFGLPPDTPLILGVGRLHPQKRHDVLIDAAGRWRELRPPPVALIAGVGPAYRRLAAQIALNRAPVILIGQREDISDLVHAADIAIVTSDGEGSPLFVQEALASGVPLVATAVGGVIDLVGSSADGPAPAVLVPPGDVDAVDAAVRTLLADPARHAELAAAGIARAATWPTEDEMLARIVSTYAELLTSRSDAVRR